VLGLSRPGEPASERLHAVIVPDEEVLRERGIVNLRELIRFEVEGLSVQLPAHKRILSYDISLEPLPRTTTGKLAAWISACGSEHRGTGTERQETSDEAAWRSSRPCRALTSSRAGSGVRLCCHQQTSSSIRSGFDGTRGAPDVTGTARRRVPANTRDRLHHSAAR
jgi:hypothetical protein